MKPRDSTLTKDEATELVNRLVAMGYRPNQITSIVQEGVRRDDLAAALIAAQREAPKA